MASDWRFGVVGNIVHEHLDENGIVRYGTKAFSGGTKVYINGYNWTYSPGRKIAVIGLNRFKRHEVDDISPELIENVRFQIIRKPKVLDMISYMESIDGTIWWNMTPSDRKEAQQFAKNWERLKEEAMLKKKLDE